MTLLTGFAPLINKNCRVLVLGSMPGVMSLQQHQYYAHPRNAFWAIMQELFGVETDSEYTDRCRQLNNHSVAVWDVLQACRRPGSLDSSIEPASEQANDFVRLFTQYSRLRYVFFNGGAAERQYEKHVLRQDDEILQERVYQRLPSTSPAYAAMPFAEKLLKWRRLLLALDQD